MSFIVLYIFEECRGVELREYFRLGLNKRNEVAKSTISAGTLDTNVQGEEDGILNFQTYALA